MDDGAHVASAAERLFIYGHFCFYSKRVLVSLKEQIISYGLICILTVRIIQFVSAVNLKARGMLASSKRAKFGWLEARFFFFFSYIFKLMNFFIFVLIHNQIKLAC